MRIPTTLPGLMSVMLLIGCAMLLPGLAALPPLDRDEARFAQATAQMLETGDYVAIRFQDAERNKKPAGIHWLQALSVKALSGVENRQIAAYRVPSFVGALMIVMITAWLGTWLFSIETGFWAGLLIAAAPVLIGEATIAKTDAVLAALTLLAQAALAFILFGPSTKSAGANGAQSTAAIMRPTRRAIWGPVVFWMALGAGILVKGPITPLICGLTLVSVCMVRRDVSALTMIRPVLGVAILALMVLPWTIGVWQATEGRFFVDALRGDMFGKLGTAQETHGGPIGYHIALLPLLFWPAIAIVPVTFAHLVKNRLWRDDFSKDSPLSARSRHEKGGGPMVFLLGWIVPFWIILELTATKLPHYTLPVYPALAILAAHTVASAGLVPFGRPAPTDPAGFVRRVLPLIGSALFLVVGLAAASLFIVLPRHYGPAGLSTLTGIVPAALLAGVALAGSFAFYRNRLKAGTMIAVLGSFILSVGLLEGVLPKLDQLNVSARLDRAIDEAGLHAVHDQAGASALYGYREPSAIFLLGTQTRLLAPDDGDGLVVALSARGQKRAVVIDLAGLSDDETARVIGRRVPLAVIDGMNYSVGRAVRLAIFEAGTD